MKLVRLGALHCRVLDLAGSLPCLARNECWSAVPTVLRSELDAYIDFLILFADLNHWKTIELEYFAGRIDAYQALLQPARNRNLPPHSIDPEESAGKIRAWNERVAALKSQGAKRLKAYDRFERAEKPEMYETLYIPLCDHTHNNLRVLADRYIENPGDGFQLTIRTAQFGEEFRAMLFAGAVMPTETVRLLLSLQPPTRNDDDDELIESLELLQTQIMICPPVATSD